MSTFFVNEIKSLKIAIEGLERENFLMPEESRFNNVLKECVALLEKHNYSIKLLPKISKVIKDYRGLVGYFYYLLHHKHPGTIPYKDDNVDIPIAKSFVKRIIEMTGYDIDMALGFCGKLVEIVFKFEEDFNFDPGTLYNFRIFGQKEMQWVTTKAISIYNREREDEFSLVRLADKETEEYEATHNITFGFSDLEELIQKHKEKD